MGKCHSIGLPDVVGQHLGLPSCRAVRQQPPLNVSLHDSTLSGSPDVCTQVDAACDMAIRLYGYMAICAWHRVLIERFSHKCLYTYPAACMHASCQIQNGQSCFSRLLSCRLPDCLMKLMLCRHQGTTCESSEPCQYQLYRSSTDACGISHSLPHVFKAIRRRYSSAHLHDIEYARRHGLILPRGASWASNVCHGTEVHGAIRRHIEVVCKDDLGARVLG